MEVIKNIRSGKGANLNIKGRAEKILDKSTSSKTFAIKPDDFFGTIPKMLHKEGAILELGTPIFFSKKSKDKSFIVNLYIFCLSVFV